MADGFDECHKKGLSARPVCDPLAHAVSHEVAAKEGGAVCFLQYLHPSDPDVNHVDLLTPLLIVYCFSVDFFFSFSLSSLSCFFPRLRSFTAVGVQVHVCLPTWESVCVCVSVCVYTDRLLPQ